MRARLLLLLLLAALSSGCPRAFGRSNPSPPPGEAWLTPAEVESGKIVTAVAADHDLEDTLTTGGRIAFSDTRVAHVYSPVTGRVIRLDAKVGDRVRKGDPLALLDSPDLGSASAELRKAAADWEAADRNFRREQALWALHATSQLELEQAEDAWRRAKAEYDRCREHVALLGVTPETRVTQSYVLRAGIDGEVLARLVGPNAEVQGEYGGGTPAELFTIGEADPIWVFADVYEADLARIKPGARAVVEVVAYSGRTFEGRLDWVSSSLDPATRTAKIRLALPNPERLLKPEMYATVHVGVDPRRALAVPANALLFLGDQTLLFVERGRTPDGRTRFERVPVLTEGARSAEWIEVTHGLDHGDVVVTEGGALLLGMI